MPNRKISISFVLNIIILSNHKNAFYEMFFFWHFSNYKKCQTHSNQRIIWFTDKIWICYLFTTRNQMKCKFWFFFVSLTFNGVESEFDESTKVSVVNCLLGLIEILTTGITTKHCTNSFSHSNKVVKRLLSLSFRYIQMLYGFSGSHCCGHWFQDLQTY